MTRKTGRKKSKKKNSKWKEGTNITVWVDEITNQNKLEDEELFIFTDNQVFEGCLYKGHSNSRNLNGLVPRLRLVEMGTS